MAEVGVAGTADCARAADVDDDARLFASGAGFGENVWGVRLWIFQGQVDAGWRLVEGKVLSVAILLLLEETDVAVCFP